MKRIFSVACFVHFILLSAGQQKQVDSLKALLHTTSDDTTRIITLVRLAYYLPSKEAFELDEEALQLSRRINYSKGASAALAQYCNDFLATGNYVKALDYALQGLKINEEANNVKGIASNYFFIARVYLAQEDYTNALSYIRRSLNMYEKVVDPNQKVLYIFMGDIYQKMSRPDSALYYYQRSYEQFQSFHQRDQLPALLSRLGDVHAQLGNPQLALAYYKMGIADKQPGISDAEFGGNYYGIAKLFGTRNRDSAIFYASEALHFAASNPDMVIKSAQLLSELYEPVDAQKALRFHKLATNTKDSVYQASKLLQIQNMKFNEAERQKEKEAAEEKAEEERKMYLQFAGLALGVVLLFTVFLLFSHSVIANERLIKFLGVLSLLIVFEFINLLLHPFIGKVTHHSPSFTLGIMVVVAALLIPLHHQMEHWVKNRLVEKNRTIRLAAARKTVEELEAKEGKVLRGRKRERPVK